MSYPQLSRTECNAIKGLAITGIVLHNYCHWLGGIVGENEYRFFADRPYKLLHIVQSAVCNGSDALTCLPVHIMSFFGHYGVPLFLFLSGYGLVRKYESDETMVHPGHFLRYHYLKLLRLFIVGYIAFTVVNYMMPHPWHFDVLNIIAQLTMVINLLPHPDRIIWPGPYWFFGLMMQMYIIYRLLLSKEVWKRIAPSSRVWEWLAPLTLIIVCWIAQALSDPQGETLNRLRYNSIGEMLPFSIGILLARGVNGADKAVRRRLVPAAILLVSVIMAVIFGFWYQSWYIVPVMIIIATVSLVKIMPRWLLESTAWIGSISAALFVVHPITRAIYIPISRGGDIYTGLVLYVIASVCVAWLFKLLFRYIPRPTL